MGQPDGRASTPDATVSAACARPAPRPTDPAAALLLLVVIGVLGKSAQFPFQDWLPDAMEGPTPVSALIHAATMVAAGSVVLAQLLPAALGAPGARWLLGVAAR